MAIYSGGGCRTSGISKPPWHSAQHTEQAISSRLSWDVFRGHTGAGKLHNSFGNSHCTELTTSTFGCGVLWQPLNLEGIYKQLTAQLNPL